MDGGRQHFEMTGTVSRLTPLDRGGLPDHAGAGVFGGITTRLLVADWYEAEGPPVPSATVSPLHVTVHATLSDIPNVDYRRDHPLGLLGSRLQQHIGPGGLAVELWSPLLPGLGSKDPSWWYWLVPRIDFGWYGRDYAYQIDDDGGGAVQFGGGLHDGDAWSQGIHPVYAAGEEPLQLIAPIPAAAPPLALVTTVPPPESRDWRAWLLHTADAPLPG